MARDAFVDTWDPEWETTKGSVAQWRREHPRATLREIEEAVDWQVNALRARMLQDVAMASGAAQFAHAPARERPQCQGCGRPLVSRGAGERTLTTNGGQEVRLRRAYAHCPGCGLELFPLDEELGLGPERFTPKVVQAIVRLGTLTSFSEAGAVLRLLLGVELAKETVRRLTETTGRGLVPGGILRNDSTSCVTPRSGRPATPSAAASSRAPTRPSSKRGSRAAAGTGPAPMSTRCSPCAAPLPVTAGPNAGRARAPHCAGRIATSAWRHLHQRSSRPSRRQ